MEKARKRGNPSVMKKASYKTKEIKSVSSRPVDIISVLNSLLIENIEENKKNKSKFFSNA